LHNFHHFLSDELLVRCLGVASGFDLLLGLVGEGNAEHSDNISVIGFGLYEGLNEWIPLLYHLACFIFGDVHTVEVGIAVKTLDFLNLELKSSPSAVLSVVVAVCLGDLENTTLQVLRRELVTNWLVRWGQCDVSLFKAWGKYVVPFFLLEWMGTKNNQNYINIVKNW
jgi:hypothetical protein